MHHYKTTKTNEQQADYFDSKFWICDRYFYFDKIIFWTNRKLSSDELNAVRPYCANIRRLKLASSEANGQGYMPRLGWHHRYLLLQPQPEAFLRLYAITGTNALINQAELALELILPDRQQTIRLADHLEAHMWQGWRSRKQVSQNYDGTIYSGQRTARNRFTIYADRPSKVTGEDNCCKVEWRVQKKGPCEAKGLSTFTALNNFDHLSFWLSHMRLAKIDVDKLQLDYRRKFKRRLPRHNAYADLMLRIASYKGLGDAAANKSLYSSQDIKSGWIWKYFNIRNYLVSMSNEWILLGSR